MISTRFSGKEYGGIYPCVSIKNDLMMLWVHLVGRKWRAREAKEADIEKAARGLFPTKGEKLRKFGYTYPLKPTAEFQNQAE